MNRATRHTNNDNSILLDDIVDKYFHLAMHYNDHRDELHNKAAALVSVPGEVTTKAKWKNKAVEAVNVVSWSASEIGLKTSLKEGRRDGCGRPAGCTVQ